jgi:hypothetical protein
MATNVQNFSFSNARKAQNFTFRTLFLSPFLLTTEGNIITLFNNLYNPVETPPQGRICSLTREFLRPSIVAIVTISSSKMANFTAEGRV